MYLADRAWSKAFRSFSQAPPFAPTRKDLPRMFCCLFFFPSPPFPLCVAPFSLRRGDFWRILLRKPASSPASHYSLLGTRPLNTSVASLIRIDEEEAISLFSLFCLVSRYRWAFRPTSPPQWSAAGLPHGPLLARTPREPAVLKSFQTRFPFSFGPPPPHRSGADQADLTECWIFRSFLSHSFPDCTTQCRFLSMPIWLPSSSSDLSLASPPLRVGTSLNLSR